MSGQLTISRIDADFGDWQELLDLIQRAFASMEGRVDPPSSARLLTVELLRAKAAEEVGFAATVDGRLMGCVFLAERGDHFYVGKLAVDPSLQAKGVGRALVDACEAHALTAGKPMLELHVRIELTGNRAAFGRMGFRETARLAHAGYDRPTQIVMRKQLT